MLITSQILVTKSKISVAVTARNTGSSTVVATEDDIVASELLSLLDELVDGMVESAVDGASDRGEGRGKGV